METQQQITTHSIDSLIKFVKELNKKALNPLIEELQHEPSPIAVYFKLSKQDWKDLYGPHAVHIYNEIHSHEQGMCINN